MHSDQNNQLLIWPDLRNEFRPHPSLTDRDFVPIDHPSLTRDAGDALARALLVDGAALHPLLAAGLARGTCLYLSRRAATR